MVYLYSIAMPRSAVGLSGGIGPNEVFKCDLGSPDYDFIEVWLSHDVGGVRPR